MRFAFTACAFLAIGVLFSAAGCGPKPVEPTIGPAEPHDHAAHDHAEVGPHKGPLIELGNDEYHAEFMHDDATHTITIYLLDDKAAKSVPIADPEVVINLVAAGKPAQYKLAALPQPGDPAGQASCFQLVNQELCEALDDPSNKAKLSLAINGTPYSGDLAAHDHDHDHAHGEPKKGD